MAFRTQYIMTIDTETASLTGEVYDVAYIIHTRDGKIVKSFSALVREIITNPDYMMGAYYARKSFSYYIPAIADRALTLLPWSEIVGNIREDALTFDVQTVAAYNLGFDRRVLRATHNTLGNRGAVFPKPVRQLDIWEFACRARMVKEKYKTVARREGWISEVGNIRTTAECAWRYVSGDYSFIESHVALSDAYIETQILADCFRAKTRVPYNIVTGNPWKLVNAR